VDHAGNVSAPVEAAVTLDLRAPRLEWVSPRHASRFESSLLMQVSSVDEDIEVVRFRYRPAGSSEWIDLAPDVSNRPYTYAWDIGPLAYGDYEVQAQAWDTGGLTGVSDTRIVSRADLTPPVSPSELEAKVS